MKYLAVLLSIDDAGRMRWERLGQLGRLSLTVFRRIVPRGIARKRRARKI